LAPAGWRPKGVQR